MPSMLRFSWNHPRRCVRLRGVVLIDEIGNHLTWLVRKRSVKVLQLGRVFSEASTKHACALWCPMVCGILVLRNHAAFSTPPHTLTHSLVVCLARDRLQSIAYSNQAQHHAPCNQSYTQVKPLTTENNTSFRLFSTFNASKPSGPELARQGSIR